MIPAQPFSSEGSVVALASAPGRAGVAVIRLSGPQASAAIESMCRPSNFPEPRKAVLRDLADYRTGEVIDHGLVLWFPGPASFTGEDVVEFHVHGGRATTKAVLDVLCSLAGIRLAEPGAFSRRAFENGKLDLTEAEGIADLVDAETAAQRRQALRQMDGALGRLYARWAERLKQDLAFIEAEIDFSDEDIPPDLSAGRREDLAKLAGEIEAHLDDGHRGEKLREGFTVALLGAPNAGKSSLLNALSQREVAIVDPTPGTTRDVIEVQLDLGGYPLDLVDTAGLRDTADRIESEGVRRALKKAEQADFKILVFDGTALPHLEPATCALADNASLIVINKSDLIDRTRAHAAAEKFPDALYISAQTGDGLKDLTSRLIKEIDVRYVGLEQPSLTRARHRFALEDAAAHLRRALDAQETELCAEDIRLAVRALGSITGRVDIEDVLDVIFNSFCIGK